MVFDILWVAFIKILIFSLFTLRMAITDQVWMETLCICAFEVMRIGAGNTIKFRTGARGLAVVGIIVSIIILIRYPLSCVGTDQIILNIRIVRVTEVIIVKVNVLL